MANKRNATAVQVAEITKQQAVIVAVLSLIGGVAVALIGSGLITKTATISPVKQRAVRIAGVDLDLDSENRTEQALRIIAVVNGIAKAYPTDGSWAPPNPDLSSEPFTVADQPEYSIRFEVFAKDARGVITRFVSSSVFSNRLRNLEFRWK